MRVQTRRVSFMGLTNGLKRLPYHRRACTIFPMNVRFMIMCSDQLLVIIGCYCKAWNALRENRAHAKPSGVAPDSSRSYDMGQWTVGGLTLVALVAEIHRAVDGT